ncbi:hypothetical protein [Azospirillum brasilense]|nr:hypothetical protein [Azospirillum brasilense]
MSSNSTPSTKSRASRCAGVSPLASMRQDTDRNSAVNANSIAAMVGSLVISRYFRMAWRPRSCGASSS